SDGSRLKGVRVLFNASMMVFSCGASALLMHHPALKLGWMPAALLQAASTATFFLGQTVPVSIIVGLTHGGAIRRIWTNLAQMSFPYYIVSAGVTLMVNSTGHYVGWLAALLVLPLMYAIYRSYRLYFARTMEAAMAPVARAAAA